MFLAAFPNSPFKRWEGLAEWNSAPLVFGAFFQVSLMLTGFTTEDGKIGFLLMGVRWWLKKKLAGQD